MRSGKRIKGRRKQNKKKTKKNKNRYKKSEQRKKNIIIYTRIYLPGNGAKNLIRSKD